MEREIGSSYPQHIGYLGPIESYSEYVDLNEVAGIYLRYLLAAVTVKNQRVNLMFGPSLTPYMVRVLTVDGEEFQDWKLENYDKDDFEEICEELELDSSDISLEDFAKKVLLSIAPNHLVPVPAYRFVSDKNA